MTATLSPPTTIQFGELKRQHDSIAADLDAAYTRVRASGWLILGQEVAAFEQEWAAYCGAEFAVGVANGTDAIMLGLKALGVGPGDEVILPAMTAVPSALAITHLGATPVLVDVEPTSMTLDPAKLDAAITAKTRAILPVHLYGQMADVDAIEAIAAARGVPVVEDAAQGHGARWRGRRAGVFGRLAAFSFYPTKNLGAMGDGGIATTNDPELHGRLRQLRNLGQRERVKYDFAEPGYNSRLDELQAALLRAKLKHLDGWIERRRAIAAAYWQGITNSCVEKPVETSNAWHTYHLYVVRSARRDALAEHLKRQGVGTMVHYPIPVHLQDAYRALGYRAGDFPESERVANQALSLPLYPELCDQEVARVIDAVNSFKG